MEAVKSRDRIKGSNANYNQIGLGYHRTQITIQTRRYPLKDTPLDAPLIYILPLSIIFMFIWEALCESGSEKFEF